MDKKDRERLEEIFTNDYPGYKVICEEVVAKIFGECEKNYDNDFAKDKDRAKMAERSNIESCLRVGTVDFGRDGIAVFDITIKDKTILSNSRVGIQQFIRSLIRPGEQAFMFFHYENVEAQEWRFSYFYKDSNLNVGERNSAKRFTYLMGQNHSCRTALERFEFLADHHTRKEQEILSAFSVETLSDEFYRDYVKQYEKFCEYVYVNQYDEDLFGEFFWKAEEKEVRDYVKKMLGRITFLHFLQRKGWLCGDKNYLQNAFNRHTELQDDFLDGFFEPLFFGVLNTKKQDRPEFFRKFRKGKKLLPEWEHIPYLNGGLFESDLADPPKSVFPAEYFGDLLDFFAKYNFTIDENDDENATVGVDPEMLGRIFENLLEDNKDKGAFYTPKEIVKYMCSEALIAYLQNKAEDEAHKERLRKFVKSHDPKDLQNPQYVLDRIREVKICDPAIGSGAFPMGLLNELVQCTEVLTEHIHGTYSRAEIKKNIIKNSIYGVDIEKGAVDIARLRFWLSIIIDEAIDIRTQEPEPLPNLDYKIMQGNSLLEYFNGVDLSKNLSITDSDKNGLRLMFGGEVFAKEELRKTLYEYYDTKDHNVKLALRETISNSVRKILEDRLAGNPKALKEIKDLKFEENSNLFLWHTWFADVFDKGGFDIVIGNPPYGAKLSKEAKSQIKTIYQSAKTIKNVQKGSMDTFSLFIDLAISISNENSVSNYIVPLSVTSSDAMSGLHKLLKEKCSEIYVSSYGDRPKRIFESAEQQVSIIQFYKSTNADCHIYTTGINKRYSDDSLWLLLNDLSFIESTKFLRNGRIPKIGTYIEQQILGKVNSVTSSLSDLYVLDGSFIYYRKAGGRYYKVITKTATNSSAEGSIVVKDKYQDLVGACLSSNLFYWFWLIHSDWHNLRSSELEMFPIPYELFSDEDLKIVANLYDDYLTDLHKNSKVMSSGLQCFYARLSKIYIDKIDRFIGSKYGLSEDEIDFIINFDLKYRVDDEDSKPNDVKNLSGNLKKAKESEESTDADEKEFEEELQKQKELAEKLKEESNNPSADDEAVSEADADSPVSDPMSYTYGSQFKKEIAQIETILRGITFDKTEDDEKQIRKYLARRNALIAMVGFKMVKHESDTALLKRLVKEQHNKMVDLCKEMIKWVNERKG